MFYKNKRCNKCDCTYDIDDYACPNCGDINSINKSKAIINVNILKQVTLFLLGYGGLNLFAAIVQIVFIFFAPGDALSDKIVSVSNEPIFTMIVMSISYLGIFNILFIILQKDIYKFKKQLCKIKPYLVGFFFGMILVTFSIFYSKLFTVSGDNSNQIASENLTLRFPIFAILVIGIIGPILEEITYRLGLFSLINRVNKYLAYAITSIFFGLIHFNFLSQDILIELINLPVYVGSGLILCYTYEKYGLVASMSAHIFNNMLSVLTLLLGATH